MVGPFWGNASMDEHPNLAALDKLKTRIQALRAKTIDNGCTEDEALSAAAKVAELLDRYDLSLSDVEIREAPCERREFETPRKKRIPLDDCVGAVAKFCDCRVWREPHGVDDGLRGRRRRGSVVGHQSRNRGRAGARSRPETIGFQIEVTYGAERPNRGRKCASERALQPTRLGKIQRCGDWALRRCR